MNYLFTGQYQIINTYGLIDAAIEEHIF